MHVTQSPACRATACGPAGDGHAAARTAQGTAGDDDPLAEQLRRLGAEVIVQPAIRIAPPADWQPVDAALARLDEFDWLVFSSANGVRYLLDGYGKRGRSETGGGNCRTRR